MEWICKECGAYNDGADRKCSVCGAERPAETQCVCPGCKSFQMAFPGMRCEKCDWLFEETDFAPRRGDDTVLSGYIPGDDDAEEKKNKNSKRVSERITRAEPDGQAKDADREKPSRKKRYVIMIASLVLLIAVSVSAAVLLSRTNSSSGRKTGGTTTAAPTNETTTAAVPVDLSTLKTGDLIEFGSYPQRKVTDDATLAGLDKLSLSWVSYGYYSGDGNGGSGVPSGYMKYADVTYEGNKYRAVEFSSYRPSRTYETRSAYNSGQDENGYKTDTVYWFKFEHLVWRVLDPDKGLLMTENLIDSQPFENDFFYYNDEFYGDADYKYYASDWENSSIREWLNGDFFNSAFSREEQSNIQQTVFTTTSGSDPSDEAGTESVRVFLLSRDDVLNPSYGFATDNGPGADTGRVASGTDYAKCQGLRVSDGGASYWRLRTPYYSVNTDYVSDGGYISYYYSTYKTYGGVRAALFINLQSAVSQSLITAHKG